MKFTYHKEESLLYDLFMFPKLALITEEEIAKVNEPLHGSNPFETLKDSDHVDFVEKAKKDLDAFRDPLFGFYADEMTSSYDFPYLLFKAYSIQGFTSHNDYFNHILNDSEVNIKKRLLHAILSIEEDDILEIPNEKIETLLNNKDQLLKLFRAITTTENYKWTLLMLIENPVKYLELYQNLIDSIKTYFDHYVKRHHQEMIQFEKDIIQSLKQDQEEAFNQLTQGLLPSEVLDEENSIFTSFVHPYSFTKTSFGNQKVLLIGLRMEKGFKKVSEFQDTLRKNRAKVFKTLSDNTRYEVLRLIASGVTSTKKIAETLGVSSATITYHINAFLTTKVVKISKSKSIKYEVDFERLETYWQDFMNDLKN